MEKSKSFFSRQHLKALYFEYKDTAVYSFGVSTLILFANIILFFWVVKPQYDTWQENNQKIADTRQKISVIENNNKVLASLDPSKLSSDLQLALQALPAEQDYVGIMTAISSSSTNAGVSLDDYTFSLGKLRSKTDQVIPVILKVKIGGSGDSVHRFMQEIHQKLPIANLTSVDGSNNLTDVILTFFSKPLTQLTISEDKVTTPLTNASAEQTSLLEKLSSWQSTLQVPFDAVSTASDSGTAPF